MEIFNILRMFFIIGLVSFGGGPGSIAVMKEESVNNLAILTEAQFNQINGISQALPGPIGTKLAFSIGYISNGIIGGFVGIFAVAIPSVVAIIFLYSFLVKNKDDYRAKRISKFIMPIVIVLFGAVTVSLFIQSFTGINNILHSMLLLIMTLIANIKYNIHPLIIILVAMFYGYFII